MSATPITLFAPWNPLDDTDSLDIQPIINYCASRLRAILNAYYAGDYECWLDEGLIVELQFTLSYIGRAAAICKPINIPLIIRALTRSFSKQNTPPDSIRVDRDFLQFLDAGTEDDDPAAVVKSYHNTWWTGKNEKQWLSLETIDACMEHHRKVTAVSHTAPAALTKTRYTWSRHVQSLPAETSLDCDRCRLYRGVTLGVLDDMNDMRNYVNAAGQSHGAKFILEQRRAAGFFQLYEAAARKESQSNSNPIPREQIRPMVPKGSRPPKNMRADLVRQRAAAELAQAQNSPALKWTSGEPLSREEVLEVIKPHPHSGRVHSGYVKPLKSGSYHAESASPEHSHSADAIFSAMDADVQMVPELESRDYPHQFRFPPLRHYYSDHGSQDLDPAGAIFPTNYMPPPPKIIPSAAPPHFTPAAPPPAAFLAARRTTARSASSFDLWQAAAATSRALPVASRARLAKSQFIPDDKHQLDPTVYHCDTCDDTLTREETFLYRNGQFCWSCKDWFARTGRQYASAEPKSQPIDVIDLVDSDASPPARQRLAAAHAAPQIKQEIIDLTLSPPVQQLVREQAAEFPYRSGPSFEEADPMDSDDPVDIFSDHGSSASDDPVDIFSDHASAAAPSSDDPVDVFSDVSDAPIAPAGSCNRDSSQIDSDDPDAAFSDDSCHVSAVPELPGILPAASFPIHEGHQMESADFDQAFFDSASPALPAFEAHKTTPAGSEVSLPAGHLQLNVIDAMISDDPGDIFSDDEEQACTPSDPSEPAVDPSQSQADFSLDAPRSPTSSGFDSGELFASDGSNPDDAFSDNDDPMIGPSISGPYRMDMFQPVLEEELEYTDPELP